jgi:hypothetical protein
VFGEQGNNLMANVESYKMVYKKNNWRILIIKTNNIEVI